MLDRIIKIRTSNLKNLRKQAANMGADVSNWVKNQIKGEIRELKVIEKQLISVILEIEDIDETLDKLSQIIEDQQVVSGKFSVAVPTHDLMFNIETFDYAGTVKRLKRLQANEDGLRVFEELAVNGLPGDWKALGTNTSFQTVLVFVRGESNGSRNSDNLCTDSC